MDVFTSKWGILEVGVNSSCTAHLNEFEIAETFTLASDLQQNHLAINTINV